VDAPTWKCFSTERTRISYFAALARTTCAVSRKGNRMKMINALVWTRNPGSVVEGPAVSFFPGVQLSAQIFDDRCARAMAIFLEFD
jgi:hypothetical protein